MAISETRGVPIVSEQQIPNGVVVRGDIVAPKPPHLFALVCVFVGIGLAFLFGQVGLPVAGLAFAMLAFLVALITYAQRSQVGRNRATIRVTETGFIVFDRNGTAAYSVEGVAAVALDETVRFTNGVAAGIRRKGTLVVIGEFATRAISMDYFVAMGEPDPVAPLLHRVLVLGLARANETLLAGEKGSRLRRPANPPSAATPETEKRSLAPGRPRRPRRRKRRRRAARPSFDSGFSSTDGNG